MYNLLCADEVQTILNNDAETTSQFGPHKVLSFEIRPCGDDGLGYLGEYFNLRVKIDQNGTVSVERG